jgi:hypothetical protein
MPPHDLVQNVNTSHPHTPPVYDSSSEAADVMSPITILSATTEAQYGNEPAAYPVAEVGPGPQRLPRPRPLDLSQQVMRAQQSLPQSPCSAGSLQNRHMQDMYYASDPRTPTEPTYPHTIEQSGNRYEAVPLGTCAAAPEPMQIMVSPTPMQVQLPYQAVMPQQPPPQQSWHDPAPSQGPMMVVPPQPFALPSGLNPYDLTSFSAFSDFGIKIGEDANMMLPSARAGYYF